MLIIPYQQLDAEVLLSVLQEYASRDGTDYGALEYSLADKVAQLQGMLQRKEIFLGFDQASASCDLITAEDAKRFQEAYNAGFIEEV